MHGIDEVIIQRQGSAGLIRLNRPQALNSLTLPMIRAIASALGDFAADPSIASVIVKGRANGPSAPAAISACCMKAANEALRKPRHSGARNFASTMPLPTIPNPIWR